MAERCEMTFDNREMQKASEALLRWLGSQELSIGEVVLVLIQTLAAVAGSVPSDNKELEEGIAMHCSALANMMRRAFRTQEAIRALIAKHFRVDGH
jgi:hypothetical protein